MIERRPVSALSNAVVVGAGVYGVVLAVLAFFSAGFGEGVHFPLMIFFAPISLLFGYVADPVTALLVLAACAVAWPLFVASTRLAAPHQRTFGLTLLCLHYASALWSIVATQAWDTTGNPAFAFGLASLGVYAIGQIVLWRAMSAA
jgi:formate hydrogenlyase subunit 3/multisubunit Na+/H+ antiporter MnhD subunit